MSGFYLSYTQAFCPLWVFSQPLSPLYPITFLRLGIQSNSSSLYPRFFSVLGILTAFTFYIPKDFSFHGYSYCFCFSIPKDFSFHGYSYCFCFLYTQRFSLPWVFLLLFASLYPKLFFSLGIYLTFVSDIPKLLYSSEYNRCFSFHRTSFMSSITQPSFSM